MKTTLQRVGALALIILGVTLLMANPAAATPAADTPLQEGDGDEDLIEHGEYIAEIAGCKGCHTPRNMETFQMINDLAFSGGLEFDLGPLGSVTSKNLTSDVGTGIGGWTDEELEVAIRTGVSPDGLHAFPVMPYLYFNQMAEEDMTALIAFLRTLEPIENTVPREQVLPPEQLPQLPMSEGMPLPDPTDPEARAEYLFTAILACSDCHTPTDPETGAPLMEMYFAGGQPFEGPWGIVYGGNITPHDETGIGTWSATDIERVLRSGVRPNGRVVVLMPWEDWANMTENDMNATVHYLQNMVDPVENEVPAASLNEGWERYVELPQQQESGNNLLIPIIVAVVAVVAIAGVAVFMIGRRSNDVEPT